ncbi:hypothetical protein [Brevibacillus reuszeri]|uniref:hypothetical protein n=1 Tax=Brevibacillus reuszeri TaxID=54915 RepID=UPI0013E067E4|nr:hypothetical protein [Brevibacillus reuszeri]
MKRILNLLTVFALMLQTFIGMQLILPNIAHAEEEITLGTYVQFGRYLGAPIIWRVVNIDENGYMLFSDKILSTKGFDSVGDLTDGRGDKWRQVTGSSYWERSNIREWLNSTNAIV